MGEKFHHTKVYKIRVKTTSQESWCICFGLLLSTIIVITPHKTNQTNTKKENKLKFDSNGLKPVIDLLRSKPLHRLNLEVQDYMSCKNTVLLFCEHNTKINRKVAKYHGITAQLFLLIKVVFIPAIYQQNSAECWMYFDNLESLSWNCNTKSSFVKDILSASC